MTKEILAQTGQDEADCNTGQGIEPLRACTQRLMRAAKQRKKWSTGENIEATSIQQVSDEGSAYVDDVAD